MTTPAGWYPDTAAPGNERFWDGAQWTEQTRPVAPPTSTLPPPHEQPTAILTAQPTNKNWFLRHKVLTGIGAFFLIVGIASVAGAGSNADKGPDASDSPPSVTQTQSPAATTAPVATKAAVTQAPKPAAPAETSGQRNAKRAAKNYLSLTPFSRKGLIQQLSSSAGDGYSVAEATYAVDALHENWRAQAVLAAKKYLSLTPFSRSGLIEQLESSAGDKYTHAEAAYGADKALAE